jgi:lipoate-protein ligase A
MQMIARAYRVFAKSPVDIIAFEECLLHSWRSDAALLLLYVNSPSVIIGRNQNYWREVAPQCSVPVYRRSSGGGAVYHDEGNLNWALIVSRTLHAQDEELSTVAEALEALGIQAYPGARGGLFVAMDNGETVGKISGTARHFGPRNVLHHGTMLVSSDLQALRLSLGGIKVFEDLSIASVPARPVNLSQFVPSLTVEETASHLSSCLFGGKPRSVELADGAIDGDFDGCIDRKNFADFRYQFGSTEWIVGQTPPFSIVVSCGLAKAVIEVSRGVVVGILPLDGADGVSVEYASSLSQRFLGVRFDFRLKEMMEKEHIRRRGSPWASV